MRWQLFCLPAPAAAWTRLAVAQSEPCFGYGCQVAASCPPDTWPVACRVEVPQQGHSVWLSDTSCIVRNRGFNEEDEIRANAACTSMFRTFAVEGSDQSAARCPTGSVLERCYCQAEDCVVPAQIASAEVEACPAEAGMQALCMEGDTNWLLQNADDIGFVKYCGWVPYRRPLNDPDFRNDTDCRMVMLQPKADFVGACASDECQSLEDCVARCDLCTNCSAVLYHNRGEGTIRCHMQSNVYVESLETNALTLPWSFYVNERNAGCQPEAESDALTSRGVRGFRLFSDLDCSKELVPQQVFALDGSSLAPLRGIWVPRCALTGRCHAGGVSLMATFTSPQVVRCAIVDAPDKFGSGWRLAKNSAVLSGLMNDITHAEWLEVARSGASLGVRATWDGIAEVNADSARGSLDSWGAEDAGLEGTSDMLSILVALLAAVVCLVAGGFLYLRPLFNTASEPMRIQGSVAPVMLPPAAVLLEDEEGLSPDHIDVAAATFGMDATEDKDEQPLAYVTSDVLSHLQGFLDFTHLASEGARTTAAGARAAPVALHLRQALRLKDSAKDRRYAKQCKSIRRKRPELKPMTPELLSAAAAAKLELSTVLASLDAAVNESYLWYHAPVHHGLSLAKGKPWSEIAQGGCGRPIRLTESCAQVEDIPVDTSGHYAGICALILCRVCVGKFCYVAEASAEARREVGSGEFDSILEDKLAREILLFDCNQVHPEFLVLCSQIRQGESISTLAPLHLEFPLYWTLPEMDLKAPLHQLLDASAQMHQRVQRLADVSTRLLVRRLRRIENTQMWLQYSRHRGGEPSSSPQSEVVFGDLLANESLLWLEPDVEAVARVAAGGHLSPSGEMILFSEDLKSCLCRSKQPEGMRCVFLCRASEAVSSKAAKAPSTAAHTAGGLPSTIPVSADRVYPEFLVDLEEKDTE